MTGNQSFEVNPATSLVLEGKCYITDPCYFIRDEMWSDLCDKWFGDGNEDCSSRCIVKIGWARILITRTSYGDGTYKVDGAGDFCVDSGTFAIAQVDKLEAEGLLVENHCATFITFDEPTKVSVDGEGRMFVGGKLLVDTLLDFSEDDWDGDDWDGIEEDDE